MDTKLEVPLQVRELVALGIANSEAALALFFEAVAASSPPAASDPVALLRRVVAVKFDYARKVARATDVKEAAILMHCVGKSVHSIVANSSLPMLMRDRSYRCRGWDRQQR